MAAMLYSDKFINVINEFLTLKNVRLDTKIVILDGFVGVQPRPTIWKY